MASQTHKASLISVHGSPRLTGRELKIDDNRSLVRLGRDEYKYCDGDHALVLQIEMLTGKPERLLYQAMATSARGRTHRLNATS